MTTARLYGRFGGNTSLAVVTRGFESALKDAGILTGTSNVETEESEDDDRAGADARHGIYVGPLGHMGEMMKRGIHQHHWLMVTPNSDLLPQDLIQILRKWTADKTHHLMAPSRWAAAVINKELRVDGGLVGIVPHGVSGSFRVHKDISQQTRLDYEEGMFRVVHFSTSARQRKGTVELIHAWGLADLGPGKRLLCVLDTPARAGLEEALDDAGIELPSSVTLASRMDFSPAPLGQQILARAHIVCQPSRGEGFGLVPLEALACGVPVVATLCTGHSEYLHHYRAGLVPVRTGELASIDDLPGSTAPALSPQALIDALQTAKRHWLPLQEEAIAAAPLLQESWSWKASLAFFMQQLRAI